MNFPQTAVLGETRTYGNVTWQYDGVKWVRQSTSAIVPIINGGTGAGTAAGARTNLGLGNVDNTSDLNKPISTATQTAIDTVVTSVSTLSSTTTSSLANKLDKNVATPTVGVGITSQNIYLTISDPGVGYGNGFNFTRSTDGAGINVIETASDATMYEMWMSDNPDQSGDMMQWRFDDWQSVNGLWVPVNAGAMNTRLLGARHDVWGQINQRTTNWFTTSNITGTSGANKQQLFNNLPAMRIVGSTVSITALDLTGYTGTSSAHFWIKLTSTTQFSWGYGSPAAAATQTGLTVSTSPVALSNGVSVTFSATSGATGDTFTCRIFTATTNTLSSTQVTGNLTVTGTISGPGSGISSLNATNLSSGTVAPARLGTGTPSSATVLRGDNTWGRKGQIYVAYTENTSSTKSGQWAKIASVSITAQFYDATISLELVGTGPSTANSTHANITARVKQQNALAGVPVGSLFLDNLSVVTPANFAWIIVQNDATATVCELWFKAPQGFEQYYFFENAITQAGSVITYSSNSIFQVSLPTFTIQFNGSTMGMNLINQGTNTGGGPWQMTLTHNGTMTADRNLNWNLNDAARNIALLGNINFAGNLSTVGGDITLTATGTTNVTLPTTGTLAALGGGNTWTGTNTWTVAPIIDHATSPGMYFIENDQGTDLKRWLMVCDSQIWQMQTRTDANGFVATPFAISRSGAMTISGGLTISGNKSLALGGNLTTSGAFASTFTMTNTTTVTFPTTGTLATLAGTETLTNKTLSTGTAVTAGTINGTTIGATTPSSGKFTTIDASDIISQSESTARGWSINTRSVVTTFPVPSFQPTQNNTVIAIDVMPKGAPTESSGNGFAWVDVCNADVKDNGNAVYGIRNAAVGNGARISSFNYNGATAKPLIFGIHTTDAWYIDASNYHFIPAVTNTFDLGTPSLQMRYGFFATGVYTPIVYSPAGSSLDFRINGTSRWYMDATNGQLAPTVDNATDIGSSGQRIRHGYFGGTIQVDTISSSSGINVLNLCTGGTGRWYIESVNGSLIPNVDNTTSIGGSSNRVKDITAAGTILSPKASHTYLNDSCLSGFRNRIINPKMDIAIRSTSTAFTPPFSGAFVVDRYAGSCAHTTGSITFSQVADGPSAEPTIQNCLRATASTAITSYSTTQYLLAYQAVEGYNVKDFVGLDFTLSFWVKASVTGTYYMSFCNSGADRSYLKSYTISAANTWEKKSITVTGGLISAGTWNFTTGVGLYIRWCLGGPTSGSFFGTDATWNSANALCGTGQANAVGTNGNTWQVTGVQLEPGSNASILEQRPIGVEKMLCDRYAQLCSPVATGQALTTTASLFSFHLGTEMRATPSLSVLNSSPGITVPSVGTNAIAGTWTLSAGTARGLSVQFDRSAGTWTAGYALNLNTSSPPLIFTAEL